MITTKDMMTLRTPLKWSSEADLFRGMIKFTGRSLIALEVEGLTDAASTPCILSGPRTVGALTLESRRN